MSYASIISEKSAEGSKCLRSALPALTSPMELNTYCKASENSNLRLRSHRGPVKKAEISAQLKLDRYLKKRDGQFVKIVHRSKALDNPKQRISYEVLELCSSPRQYAQV